MSTWSKIYLQNAYSPNMEHLLFLHDYAMSIIMMITAMILFIMIKLFLNNMNNKFIIQNQMIEIIWTIMPMLILILLAIPSLKTLYLTDEIDNPSLTIKIIGHQWYWSYEYTDIKKTDFNSFMMNYSTSNLNNFRLLDVDYRMVIPFNTYIRLLLTSVDVIHSWAVPSLGIKIDTIPGRINQTLLYTNQPGLFFGQCSEICGMNHSFMPIVIESTSTTNFINWLKLFN